MRAKDDSAEQLMASMAAIQSDAAVGASAAEEVASKIRQLIIANDLEAGARLPSERDLAQTLQTSRPTVSQAIRILVTKGLVESRRGSGAYVTRRPEEGLATSVDLMLELNQKSVAYLADLRLWLETMSITRAIEEGTEAEIVECEDALAHLRAAAGDTAAWMSADTNFHAAIARASHNPYLASLFESVHATLINYEYRAWIQENSTPRWLRSTEVAAMSALHDPIVAALRNRDEEAGRVAVLHHHYVMAQHLATAHQ